MSRRKIGRPAARAWRPLPPRASLRPWALRRPPNPSTQTPPPLPTRRRQVIGALADALPSSGPAVRSAGAGAVKSIMSPQVRPARLAQARPAASLGRGARHGVALPLLVCATPRRAASCAPQPATSCSWLSLVRAPTSATV